MLKKSESRSSDNGCGFPKSRKVCTSRKQERDDRFHLPRVLRHGYNRNLGGGSGTRGARALLRPECPATFQDLCNAGCASFANASACDIVNRAPAPDTFNPLAYSGMIDSRKRSLRLAHFERLVHDCVRVDAGGNEGREREGGGRRIGRGAHYGYVPGA